MSEIGRLLWLQIELSRMDAVLGEQQSLEGRGFRPADGFRQLRSRGFFEDCSDWGAAAKHRLATRVAEACSGQANLSGVGG